MNIVHLREEGVSMFSAEDEYYMRVALGQARRGLGHVAPNPAVGCVLVKDGCILAVAHTADGGRPHAEALALQQADGASKGATAYVSLEPCAHQGKTGPCALALIDAGVKRVVIACIDPDPRVSGRGVQMLENAGIEVLCGVLEEEALNLNKGFIFKVTRNRPFVTLKLALSADKKIAVREGSRTQISGALAGRYTQFLRSQHDAILIGIGTALVDNPVLISRVKGHLHVMPRVILDAALEIPMGSNLVQSIADAPVFIIHDVDDVDKTVDLKAAGCTLIRENPRNLEKVLALLTERGVTRLLVEGGARVAQSFLEAGLVDECQLIYAPVKLGPGGVAAFPDTDIEVYGMKLKKTRVLGEDLLEIYGAAD
ncbi:MAG: bifunctional diaminohydroxyphosphoribosylaminopyrimidine deaminase/5-amino-6-(5-phosphoribosylamino)uracil reductase RibD [Alphaproteobacteria bacterium]|nr:bifunctional diaminohydroxyphosphoribosylaminopyrimidine deaminase/5-amino-6-(5-phosphoribosylamino)uracil reductase RibD [Alphaproteobacteria bacterium]